MEIRVAGLPSLSKGVVNLLTEEGSPGGIQEEVKAPGSRKKEGFIGYFPNDRYLEGKKKGLTTFLCSWRPSPGELRPGNPDRCRLAKFSKRGNHEGLFLSGEEGPRGQIIQGLGWPGFGPAQGKKEKMN